MLQKLRQRLNLAPWERNLYIIFVTQIFTAVGFASIFPFLSLYVEDLGSVSGMGVELLAGLVFSSQAVAMAISAPIWGRLADRFGRKLMVQRAQFGGAILLGLMAVVQNAEQLVFLRTVQGLVTGVVAANTALIAAMVPRERTGYAMGLLQVGLGAGVAIGPLIGGALADAFGYHIAFYGTGFLLLLAGVLVTFGVHEEFDPQAVKQTKRTSMLAEWRTIFKTPGVSATYAMRFTSQMARMMIIPMLPLFIQALMPNTNNLNTFIGLVLGVSYAATTLSSIYLGKLGDRIGHRSVLIVSLLAATISYLPQSRVTAGWQLLALQALTGVAIGGIIPMISALLATYTQGGAEGAVYGLDSSINSAGRAVAPMLGGAVAVWFDLPAIFTATAIILLASALLAQATLPKSPLPVALSTVKN